MKIEVAKQFVQSMQAAIERAEAEGRDYLNTGDLASFAEADDAARGELQAALDAAKVG
jgi:hypothetical protein